MMVVTGVLDYYIREGAVKCRRCGQRTWFEAQKLDAVDATFVR